MPRRRFLRFLGKVRNKRRDFMSPKKVRFSSTKTVWLTRRKLKISWTWYLIPLHPLLLNKARATHKLHSKITWILTRRYPRKCFTQLCRFSMRGSHAHLISLGWKRYTGLKLAGSPSREILEATLVKLPHQASSRCKLSRKSKERQEEEVWSQWPLRLKLRTRF